MNPWIKYLIAFTLPFLLLFPLSIKWEIRREYAFPWLIFTGFASCVSLAIFSSTFHGLTPIFEIALVSAQSIFLTGAILLACFYRDPERDSPSGERLIVSPADGEVIYVKTIGEGEFPFAVKKGKKIDLEEFIHESGFMTKGVQIGIAMNFLNVHVNRAPLTGTVKTIRKIPGSFSSLKHLTSLMENERVCTIINGSNISVCVVQIASRLVRRITSYFHEGDTCNIGDRLGMIKFGSQVDILIPETGRLQVRVRSGQRLKAGESIIANF